MWLTCHSHCEHSYSRSAPLKHIYLLNLAGESREKYHSQSNIDTNGCQWRLQTGGSSLMNYANPQHLVSDCQVCSQSKKQQFSSSGLSFNLSHCVHQKCLYKSNLGGPSGYQSWRCDTQAYIQKIRAFTKWTGIFFPPKRLRLKLETKAWICWNTRTRSHQQVGHAGLNMAVMSLTRRRCLRVLAVSLNGNTEHQITHESLATRTKRKCTYFLYLNEFHFKTVAAVWHSW